MRSLASLLLAACASGACGHPHPTETVVQNSGGDDCPAVQPSVRGPNPCGLLISTILDDGKTDHRHAVFGDSYVASQVGRVNACARGSCWPVQTFGPGTMTADLFVSPTCRTAAAFLQSEHEDAPTIYVVDLCHKTVAKHASVQALERVVEATWLHGDRLRVESSGHSGVGWTEVFSRQGKLDKRYEHGP